MERPADRRQALGAGLLAGLGLFSVRRCLHGGRPRRIPPGRAPGAWVADRGAHRLFLLDPLLLVRRTFKLPAPHLLVPTAGGVWVVGEGHGGDRVYWCDVRAGACRRASFERRVSDACATDGGRLLVLEASGRMWRLDRAGRRARMLGLTRARRLARRRAADERRAQEVCVAASDGRLYRVRLAAGQGVGAVVASGRVRAGPSDLCPLGPGGGGWCALLAEGNGSAVVLLDDALRARLTVRLPGRPRAVARFAARNVEGVLVLTSRPERLWLVDAGGTASCGAPLPLGGAHRLATRAPEPPGSGGSCTYLVGGSGAVLGGSEPPAEAPPSRSQGGFSWIADVAFAFPSAHTTPIPTDPRDDGAGGSRGAR